MRHGIIRLLLVLGALAAIEGVTRGGLVDEITLIPPSEMLLALIGMLRSGRILGDLAFTLRNTGIAIVIAVFGGFAIGAFLHATPRLRQALAPFLESYYAVPVFVFYPLLVGIFGLNAVPAIVIGAMFGVVAMVVNTLIGIDRIPVNFLKAAHSY